MLRCGTIRTPWQPSPAPPYERPLACTVRRTVVRVLVREGELDLGVLVGGLRVGDEVIAKSKVGLNDGTVERVHVEDVSPNLLAVRATLLWRMALEKEAVTGDVVFQTFVYVADLFQRLNASLSVLELVQQHGDIEDRLGGHIRNGRAANVVDACHDVPDGGHNTATLLLEQPRPFVIVRLDHGGVTGQTEGHR